MTPAEKLTNAQANLTIAEAAYQKALVSKQYVQTGQRRHATHDLKELLANVQYWQLQVDKLNAAINGGVRPHITPPLRPYL